MNTAGQVRPITCKACDSIKANEKAKTGNSAKSCKDAIQKHNYLIIDYNFLNDIRVNRQQIFSGLEARYRGTIVQIFLDLLDIHLKLIDYLIGNLIYYQHGTIQYALCVLIKSRSPFILQTYSLRYDKVIQQIQIKYRID